MVIPHRGGGGRWWGYGGPVVVFLCVLSKGKRQTFPTIRRQSAIFTPTVCKQCTVFILTVSVPGVLCFVQNGILNVTYFLSSLLIVCVSFFSSCFLFVGLFVWVRVPLCSPGGLWAYDLSNDGTGENLPAYLLCLCPAHLCKTWILTLLHLLEICTISLPFSGLSLPPSSLIKLESSWFTDLMPSFYPSLSSPETPQTDSLALCFYIPSRQQI